jgi:trypsin
VLDRVAAQNAKFAAPAAGAEARIIGGSLADPNPHKFQVGLLLKANMTGTNPIFNGQYCGGTLFKGKYVITAAHCSDFTTAADVKVFAKSTRLKSGTGVLRNVTKITIHPNWEDTTFDYDVAVWELSKPISDVPNPVLVSADPADGKSLTVTGWGNTSTTGSSFPVRLRKVKVPLTPLADCNDADSYAGGITSRMFCAGLEAGGKDSCQGDSGGPIAYKRTDGRRILTGIVSWGIGCAQPELFGVYTRIADPEIRNFIITNTP